MLLDPLHLLRIEGGVGKVHQCQFPTLGLHAVRHAHRDVDDHARLECDRLVSVGHGPTTADNVEHVRPIVMPVRLDFLLDCNRAYSPQMWRS